MVIFREFWVGVTKQLRLDEWTIEGRGERLLVAFDVTPT